MAEAPRSTLPSDLPSVAAEPSTTRPDAAHVRSEEGSDRILLVVAGFVAVLAAFLVVRSLGGWTRNDDLAPQGERSGARAAARREAVAEQLREAKAARLAERVPADSVVESLMQRWAVMPYVDGLSEADERDLVAWLVHECKVDSVLLANVRRHGVTFDLGDRSQVHKVVVALNSVVSREWAITSAEDRFDPSSASYDPAADLARFESRPQEVVPLDLLDWQRDWAQSPEGRQFSREKFWCGLRGYAKSEWNRERSRNEMTTLLSGACVLFGVRWRKHAESDWR